MATSLEHLTPRPTWPSVSPTTTKALNLVLQFVVDKRVDDLILLDWERVEVDLLEAPDLAFSHQTAEFRDWDPLLFFLSASSAATATWASTVAPPTTAEAASECTALATSFSHGFVLVCLGFEARVWALGE